MNQEADHDPALEAEIRAGLETASEASRSPSLEGVMKALRRREQHQRRRTLALSSLATIGIGALVFGLWPKTQTQPPPDSEEIPRIAGLPEPQGPEQSGSLKPVNIPALETTQEAVLSIIAHYRPERGVIRKSENGGFIIAVEGMQNPDEKGFMNALEQVLKTWDAVEITIHQGAAIGAQRFVRWTHKG